MPTILFSAGDASGEAHAAELVSVLRDRRPDTRFVGLGGPRMAAAGVSLLADQRALAVGGLFEVAGSFGRIGRTWRAMTQGLRETDPDLVVLVDSGGFNLPFARHVKKHSRAKVLYYVAPQLWAWRAGRLRKLVERTDRIAVLLPFERDFYAARDVQVDLVGHPVLDTDWAEAVDGATRDAARAALGIEPGARVLGLLPGSRRNEVRRHLPLQLAALARLRECWPEGEGLEAIVGLAPSLDPDWVRAVATDSGADASVRFEAGDRRLFDAVDVAVAKPGTVTVELMLRERPMVVVGQVHPLTARIASRALEVDWLAMPNLIEGRPIVPEFLQDAASADRIAEALAPLFPESRGAGPSPAARAQLEGFEAARTRLGGPGATGRVAALVEEMLGTDRS